MTGYGQLTITDNTTPTIAPATAAVHTQGWVAGVASAQGNASVTPSASAGTLTLKPGVYLIQATGTIETEDVSGTTASDVNDVNASIFKDGTVLAGTKRKQSNLAFDRPQNFAIQCIVTVTTAQAGVLDLRLGSSDASGSDVTLSNCVFSAVRLD